MLPPVRTVRESILALLPRWLLDESVGKPYHYSYGVILDAVYDWAYQGVRARFPAVCPEDALPYHGTDRQLPRGPQEPASSYRIRLIQAITSWRGAGGSYGVLQQIVGYLTPSLIDMTVVSASSVWEWIVTGSFLSAVAPAATLPFNRIDASGTPNWNWDGASLASSWARAWVILYPKTDPSGNYPFVDDGTWGDGSVWGDDGTSWGSTATVSEVADIRLQIVKAFRPLHIQVTGIIISFASRATEFNPVAPPGNPSLPAGTWGQAMTYIGGVAAHGRTLNGANVCDVLVWDVVQ